jgi:hypothetical protein
MADQPPEKEKTDVGFAPLNPTDGRQLFEWKSKYPLEAKRAIRIEASVVIGTLFLVPIGMFLVWQGSALDWLGLDAQKKQTFARYSFAWLGGTLGGTLFCLKWLYHSVARGIWHLERRLWRLFTPHISGGHAFAIIVLMSSGILRIFDTQELSRPSVIVGVGFLVGYFSDSAIGKLTELANTLFGTSSRRYPDEGEETGKEVKGSEKA